MKKRRKKRTRPPLDDRHYYAIELLTTVPTPTLDETAQACNVDRRTLYRWRQRPDFHREYTKAVRRKADEEYRRFRAKRKYELGMKDIEEVFRICGLIS